MWKCKYISNIVLCKSLMHPNLFIFFFLRYLFDVFHINASVEKSKIVDFQTFSIFFKKASSLYGILHVPRTLVHISNTYIKKHLYIPDCLDQTGGAVWVCDLM